MVESSQFAKRAEENRQKGEAALKGSFFGNFTKSKSDRQDDAIEFF